MANKQLSEVDLVLNCHSDNSYKEGVKDTLLFLSQDGVGIGKLRELVNQINKAYERQFKENKNSIPESEF